MAEILIIDDDPRVAETIGSLFEQLGHHYTLEYTMDKGLARAMSSGYDLVFLDVNLPDGCGLDLINDLRGTTSQPEVIIITGAGNANGAETAINCNAWDYVEKGSSIKEFVLSSNRALQYRQEKLASRKPVSLKLDHIAGKSAAMKKCYDLVAQAASSLTDVLITGETGTGKELIAGAIHQNSSRAAKNFVVVDCAALPPSMISSVLFGHEKGAFTGAEHRHKGLVAQAEGGTLFLDEVGELTLEMQKNFLRVLQEHKYRP
ncbi:MAG: sigma 54-interacting transcriptional regulator, partial [Pseudomonadota bacterium]|nr:sigma 54-interacting transcriptional regulator [Pseudomonadota bacterium]